MMHSGILKWLGMASWLITALASINVGLAGAFGWNLFSQSWFPAAIVMPVHYIIGLSGVYSLVLLAMMFSCGCGKCGTKDCKCK